MFWPLHGAPVCQPTPSSCAGAAACLMAAAATSHRLPLHCLYCSPSGTSQPSASTAAMGGGGGQAPLAWQPRCPASVPGLSAIAPGGRPPPDGSARPSSPEGEGMHGSYFSGRGGPPRVVPLVSAACAHTMCSLQRRSNGPGQAGRRMMAQGAAAQTVANDGGSCTRLGEGW